MPMWGQSSISLLVSSGRGETLRATSVAPGIRILQGGELSRVGDHEHRGGSIQDAAEDLAEGLRVKRREALIEDDQVCVLEERPGDVEAAPFTMGELPASLADSLQQSGRHAVEKVSKTERAAEGFGLLQIFGLRRPAAAHQQVEGEGFREDVVLVELRRPHYTPPPALGPKCLPVEALEEEETRLRQAQANEQGGEGGLAATGGAFEENAVARADPQVATSENGFAPLVVAEDEVIRIEDRLAVLRLGSAGAARERVGRRPTDLWTSPGVEEEGNLLPGNRRTHEIRQALHQFS